MLLLTPPVAVNLITRRPARSDRARHDGNPRAVAQVDARDRRSSAMSRWCVGGIGVTAVPRSPDCGDDRRPRNETGGNGVAERGDAVDLRARSRTVVRHLERRSAYRRDQQAVPIRG